MTPRADRLAPGTLRRWLAPPFTALIFLIHPIVALTRASRQLLDPGTGWHLATGRYVLDTGTVPHRDIFSFTAAGHQWISYYWLFDAAGAALERAGGLPLYATACVLVYAFLPVLLFRRMLRIGAGMAPAFLVTVAAYTVLLSHSLARPHVLTYVFFALLLERLDDVHSGRRPARALWWLPLLALVWCNVHGGFMAGLALVGIFAGVAAARAVLARDAAEWRHAVVFGLALCAMTLVTLANPNGVRLHLDILQHLAMQSTGYFNEFRSPNFQDRGAPIFFFQVMILGLVALFARSARKLAWVEVALVVFFLHEALQSVRHMNLFVIVAAPIVAREITPVFARYWPRLHARLARIATEQAALRSPLVYFPAFAGLFLALAAAAALPFPRTLEGLRLSRGAADFIARHQARFARPFNTDDLGGSLIYRFWPRVRVFVDDRIYVYGDDFVMHRYFTVFYAKKRWQRVLAKYRITAAVVTATTACATLFRASPDWELVFDDGKNAIFFPRPAEAPG